MFNFVLASLIKIIRADFFLCITEREVTYINACIIIPFLQVADPNNEPGTVVQVAVAGYMLNGRVLRAADVIVVQEED